jgi:hypothetical protein
MAEDQPTEHRKIERAGKLDWDIVAVMLILAVALIVICLICTNGWLALQHTHLKW